MGLLEAYSSIRHCRRSNLCRQQKIQAGYVQCGIRNYRAVMPYYFAHVFYFMDEASFISHGTDSGNNRFHS